MKDNIDLKKKNRTLKCKITGRDIIVKPDKYERLFKYYGDEDKIKKNFISYSVEKEAREPTFKFWFENCSEMKYFKSRIIKILETFKISKRTQNDVLDLQTQSSHLCNSSGVDFSSIEFIQSDDSKGRYLQGIIIKNIPFIKTYKITINEKTTN